MMCNSYLFFYGSAIFSASATTKSRRLEIFVRCEFFPGSFFIDENGDCPVSLCTLAWSKEIDVNDGTQLEFE